jgi:hypothetical protein
MNLFLALYRKKNHINRHDDNRFICEGFFTCKEDAMLGILAYSDDAYEKVIVMVETVLLSK